MSVLIVLLFVKKTLVVPKPSFGKYLPQQALTSAKLTTVAQHRFGPHTMCTYRYLCVWLQPCNV